MRDSYYSTFFIFLFVGYLTCCTHQSLGQKVSQKDTIRTKVLEELIIQGSNYEDFTVALNRLQVNSLISKGDQLKSLSQALSEQTPIYFKNYGNGMLSTISLRGTSASQTVTLWNGININYPFLGQFDFSQAPLIKAQSISVVPGGSSSVFGSEALGGSVIIEAQPGQSDYVSITQQIGSFNTFNTGLNVVKTGKNLESQTSFYLNSSKNNFPYRNYARPDSPVEIQSNATYFQYGLIQDLFIATDRNGLVEVNLWYNYSEREIQPSITVNNNDQQEDQNIRLNATYRRWSEKTGDWKFQLAGTHDNLVFNESEPTYSTQYHASIENLYTISKWKFNTGVNSRFYTLQGTNYKSRQSELRNDLFLLTVFEPSSRLSFNLNLRQSFYAQNTAPFAPSLGLRWQLLKSSLQELSIRAQASRNFRFPTLNDRYWFPGGNPNILPEQGLMVETSLDLSRKNFSLVATLFRSWMSDLIVWLPQGSFWSPVNLKEVDIYGFEALINGSVSLDEGASLQLGGAYQYNRSLNRTTIDEFDRSLNKQLPYVPLHNLNLRQLIELKRFQLRIIENFTGEQFVTTDNEDNLDAFFLIDIQGGYEFNIKSYADLYVGAEIRNLFDTEYQQLKHRAMPGRNLMLTINLTF